LYSSGGAHSYWNLLLYLEEKYTDRATAILASKYFAVDIDRESQSAFMMFQGQKGHGDEEVRRAQEFIEENVQEKITIDENVASGLKSSCLNSSYLIFRQKTAIFRRIFFHNASKAHRMETVIASTPQNTNFLNSNYSDGIYYPDTDVFYGYNIAPQVMLEFFSDSITASEMTDKIAFLEQYGVQEYYIYNLERKELSGLVRVNENDQVLKEIPDMTDWKSPRLGIRFDMSLGYLVLWKPNDTPFLKYSEYATIEHSLVSERQRAEAFAAKLRELGIDPETL
jgi:hypothetical protein